MSRPDRRGKGKSESSSESGLSTGGLGQIDSNLAKELGNTKFGPKPPVARLLYNGRSSQPDLYRDRDLAAKPSVFLVADAGTNWDATVGMQSIAGTGGAIDPTVAAVTISPIDTLYSKMIRNVNAKRLRTSRDSTITSGVSMFNWIGDYNDAYRGLRNLEGWLAAGDQNLTCGIIARNINTFLDRIQADLGELYKITVPPGWTTLLDRTCGPKANDADSTVYSWVPCGVQGTNVNLALDTDVDALLTIYESRIADLLDTDDGAKIASTLAGCFGMPTVPKSKGIVYSPLEVSFITTSAWVFRDTGITTGNFIAPNRHAAEFIPILIPSGTNDVEGCKQALSLLRGPVFSNDPIAGNAGVGSQAGLFNTQLLNTTGNIVAYYNQGGTEGTDHNIAVAPSPLTYQSADYSFWWAHYVWSEVLVYDVDARDYNEWDVNWVSPQELADSSVKALNNIWLQGVKTRS